MVAPQPLSRHAGTCAVLAFASALIGLGVQSNAGISLTNATEFEGHAYSIVADPLATWSEALAEAQNANGYLATLTSAAEQAFVQQLLVDAAAPAGAYWIGLQKSGGGFAWVNGEPLAHTHWLSGQPDNNGGNETVAAILWSNTGQNAASVPGTWNDLPDPYESAESTYVDLNNGGYVIEYPAGAPAAVPLPPAALVAPLGMAIVGLVIRRVRRAQA